MMQIPNLPVCVPAQQPSYNAVKIDVHNPMVNVPASQQMPAPQYAAPTMPYYSYPQAQVQPYYMPPCITAPEAPTVVPPTVTETPVQPVPVATVPVKELPKQPEITPPAPVITEQVKAEEPKAEAPKAAEEKPVEVVEPKEVKPQVDLNEFIAKLTNNDYDVQAAAMEEIANMVDKEPQKATELLDTKVVDALTNIMTADTSALEGPTAEQQAARQKMFANEQLTEDEQKLATTISPKEQAERNKSYAMFTAAIMQKLYGEEVQKLTNSVVPLTELPGAVTVVEQLKNNPNPMVRTSAVEALSYIQNPSYKKDLETIFKIAQNDQDKNVKDAATAALAKLAEV